MLCYAKRYFHMQICCTVKINTFIHHDLYINQNIPVRASQTRPLQSKTITLRACKLIVDVSSSNLHLDVLSKHHLCAYLDEFVTRDLLGRISILEVKIVLAILHPNSQKAEHCRVPLELGYAQACLF
jgi:hypothetical protein